MGNRNTTTQQKSEFKSICITDAIYNTFVKKCTR